MDKRKTMRHAGQFKPGQSGNPSGRRKWTAEEKELAAEKRELQRHMAQMWPHYMNMSKEEFAKVVAQENLKMADVLLFKQVQAASNGDRQALEFMLTYMGVKPSDKQELEVSGSFENIIQRSRE